MIKTNYSAGTITLTGVELGFADMARLQDCLTDAIIGGEHDALQTAELAEKLGISIDADLLEDGSPNVSTTGLDSAETEDDGLPNPAADSQAP